MPNPASAPLPTGDKVVQVSVTPTLDTAAFISGDVIATAILTFSEVFASNGGTATILKYGIIDSGASSASTELWLFDTAVTPAAANAAHAISDADALHCVGVIGSGTYFASSNNSVAFATSSLKVKADSASRNLYGILVTRGTPTYTATALTIVLTVAQD